MLDWMKSLIVIVSMVVVFAVKFFIPSYQDDNIFEETTEKLIEYGTGVDIDLTPLSPESK